MHTFAKVWNDTNKWAYETNSGFHLIQYPLLDIIRAFGQWPQGKKTKKIFCIGLVAKTLHFKINQYLSARLYASENDDQESMLAISNNF